MGVDFFPCGECGKIICDAGDLYYCDCGKKFCYDDDCREKAGLKESDKVDCDGMSYFSCAYCRKEKFTDGEMLYYLLTKDGLSYDELAAKMREFFKSNPPLRAMESRRRGRVVRDSCRFLAERNAGETKSSEAVKRVLKNYRQRRVI